ncbi:nucleotidyltransferase family protein [Bacillus sp. Bva_UNVM-123]|uniref:nucleotidyltransferase family protein n=1 Tax=Bacillus sp. Bva_UNVM-123 TaxID=2829798 RepID=UPI00391F8AC3
MKETKKTSSICAIILAAGTSTRMGKAKQLLLLNEKPLLEHVIQHALAVDFAEVITVIGYNAQPIQNKIAVDDHRFHWVINHEYALGLSTSLQAGILHVSKHHNGIMVFLGDLPFLLKETVQSIFLAGNEMLMKSDKSFMIQPSYHGKSGHPVFFGNFDRNLFMGLKGDIGAKAVIKNIPNRKMIEVKDKGILTDIDTPEAYEKAKQYYVDYLKRTP